MFLKADYVFALLSRFFSSSEGFAFLFEEAIPSSRSLYLLWDMVSIEIIEQSISWSPTPDQLAQ